MAGFLWSEGPNHTTVGRSVFAGDTLALPWALLLQAVRANVALELCPSLSDVVAVEESI